MMAIGHRVGRRGALKPMLVLLFLSSVLLLTIISRTDKKRPFNLEPRHVQDSHDDYAGRRHLTRSFQTDLRKRAVMPEILDPDAEITGMSKRWSEPEKNATIEFNTRHKKKTYVRFILAKSVSEDKDSLPVTISQKECLSYVDQPFTKYNEQGLRTFPLAEDPKTARACQSFYALEAWPVDQMEKNSVDPLDSERKQAFMAVIHSDTKKKIGWDVTYDPAGSVPIRWAEKVEPDNWKNQLLVSCKSWWYQTEVHPVTPQYYGQNCLLKIPRENNPSAFNSTAWFCLGSESDEWDNLSKNPGTLTRGTCRYSSESSSDSLSTQSVAQEWPDYYPANDKRKHLLNPDSNPRDLFKACNREKCLAKLPET